jgi:hypothetical protein
MIYGIVINRLRAYIKRKSIVAGDINLKGPSCFYGHEDVIMQ